jgi:hypothetical protein
MWSSVVMSRSVMALTPSCSNIVALWIAWLDKGTACAPIWLGMGSFLSMKFWVKKNEVPGQGGFLMYALSGGESISFSLCSQLSHVSVQVFSFHPPASVDERRIIDTVKQRMEIERERA